MCVPQQSNRLGSGTRTLIGNRHIDHVGGNAALVFDRALELRLMAILFDGAGVISSTEQRGAVGIDDLGILWREQQTAVPARRRCPSTRTPFGQ